MVVTIALVISISKCRESESHYDSANRWMMSLTDTITHLKNGIAQKPAVVVTQEAFEDIVAQNKTLQKAIKDAEFKVKNVSTITQVITKTYIDTISITLHDSIPCNDFIPIAFAIDSAYYSIAGVIKKKSLAFTTINFPDSLSVITAKKKHLFRKNEFIVSVSHSNPLIKTVGITNLTISEQRKWWQSEWLKAGVGFVGGIVVSQKLMK